MTLVSAWTGLWLLVLLYAEGAQRQGLRRVAKPLASIGFLAAAVQAGLLDSALGPSLGLAFGLSFLGDVLLLSTQKRGLLLGLGAFALAHLAFVAGFWTRGLDPLAVGVAGGGLALVGALVWRWLSPHVGSMRGPVLGYVFVVSAMLAAAIGSTVNAPNVGLLFGALCFYVSDLFVARHRFVAPGFVNKLWGLPLYYGGQLLIASFVLR